MKPFVALLLVATALAGCVQSEPAPENTPAETPVLDAPSAAVFDVLPVVEQWIAMDDGKAMHAAVYLPDGDPAEQMHVDGSTGWPVFINFSPYWGDTAELGGDAFSQYMIGEYVPRGYAVVLASLRGTGHSEGCFQIGGDRELMDMHDVVDHYAKAGWSNGKVATGGKSYDSSPTNGLIAKYPHPALRGVFHVSGITDMYGYNSKGGLPYATGPVFNTYYYLQGTDEYGVSLVGAGSADDEDPDSLARVIDDAACTEMPLIQAHGVGSGGTGMKTDYWIERDWVRHVPDTDWNGSIFFVHGLQDWNVKPDHILPWIDNLPPAIRVKGWLHQGGHVYPERTDWNETMLAWLDAELKGHDNRFWDEARWEVRSDDGDWYQHHVWPTTYEDGRGVEATNRDGGTVTGAKLEAGPDGMHLSGSIRVNATVSSDVPDATLLVTIYDEGGGQRTWVTEGALRLMYHESLDMPTPYTPGNRVDLSLLTYPADHIFPPGHQMVIEFGGEPRYPIATDQQTDVAVYRYDAGVPIAWAQRIVEQPQDMECFAC